MANPAAETKGPAEPESLCITRRDGLNRASGLNRPHLVFLAKQTAINVAMMAAVTGLMTFAVFHGKPSPGSPSLRPIMVDFIPSSLFPGFVTGFVMTLATRGAMAKHRLSTVRNALTGRLPRSAALRGLMTGLFTLLTFGPVGFAVLYLLFGNGISFVTLVFFKTAFGATLALLMTPPTVLAAMAERSSIDNG